MYDSRAGHRLSEEFAIDPNSDELYAMLKGSGSNGKSSAEKSALEEGGVNLLPQKILASRNVRKVGFRTKILIFLNLG